MSRLEDKFRERLLGHLSDANTEVDVKIAVEVCKDFAISFSLFCAENYIPKRVLNKPIIWENKNSQFTTEELMKIYLNRD